jgi:hypothetical protein
MRSIVFAALFAAGSACATATYDNGSLAIVFQDAACDRVSLSTVLGQYADGPKKQASVMIGGKIIHACYVVDGDGDYLILDERGAGGFIPKADVNQKDA